MLRINHPLVTVTTAERQVLSLPGTHSRWLLVSVVVPSPVAVRLDWSSPETDGFSVSLTVSRSTRICVWAASLKLTAWSVSNAETTMIIGVVEQYERTANTLQIDGTGTGAPQAHPVPAFGRTVRLETADHSAMAGATLSLIDAYGNVRASVPGNAQPEAGVLIGACNGVQVTVANGQYYRLVYGLDL